MESNIVKASDCSEFVVDLKRKHPCEILIGRNKDSFSDVNLPKSNIAKRRKLDGCKCVAPLSKSVVRYYFNFLKSGQPSRVVYYHGGEWIDFPLPLLDLIKEHFTTKNAVFEIELNGTASLLDFVHMMKLELKSGMQQSIAWIDEAGNCFFPEKVFSDIDAYGDEAIHCCHPEREEEPAYKNQSSNNEIKLQLEIDINGLYFSKVDECTGESGNLDEQQAGSSKIAAKYQGLQKLDGVSADSSVEVIDQKNKRVGLELEYMNRANIRDLFLKGMQSFDGTEIIDVYRGSSQMLHAREELFRKQVEITAKYRGDANVSYAWLPCTRNVSASIMKYGIGSIASSSSIYGVGLHVIAADCANLSVNIYDVDENGVQHAVLCKVVLGNMEVVSPGSRQFHPSSEEYDTGVDDLKSPKYHVIWNMDLTSRIYPEYVISFKVAPSIGKGAVCLVKQQVNKRDTSGVTASQGSNRRQLVESASNELVAELSGVNKGASRTTPMAPKSPWMPFPALFAAISHLVSQDAMKLINIEYDLFKKNMTMRGDFVKKLRLIVGDELLRSTITQLQCQVPHTYGDQVSASTKLGMPK